MQPKRKFTTAFAPKYFIKRYNDESSRPLHEALECAKHASPLMRVWGEDIKPGHQMKKYFVAPTDTVYDMIKEPNSEPAYYEHLSDLFGYTRLVADLDACIPKTEDPIPVVCQVIDALINNVKQDFNLSVTFNDFIVTESGYKHDKGQYSYHLSCPSIIFESMDHLRQWMNSRICPDHPSVDRQIYSSNRMLRVCYAAKLGSKRYANPLLVQSQSKADTACTLMPSDFPSDYDFWIASLVKTNEPFNIPSTSQPTTSIQRPRTEIPDLVPKTSLSLFLAEQPLAKACFIRTLSILVPSIDWSKEQFVLKSYFHQSKMYIHLSCPRLRKCLVDPDGPPHSAPGKSYIILSKSGFQCKCFSAHSKRTSHHSEDGRTVSAFSNYAMLSREDHCDYSSLFVHLETYTLLQMLSDTTSVSVKEPLITNRNNCLVINDPDRQIEHVSISSILTKSSEHNCHQTTLLLDAPTKAGKSGEIRKQIVECFDAFTPLPRICILVHRRTLGSHTKSSLLEDLPLHLRNHVQYYTDVDHLTKPISIVSIESLAKLDTTTPFDLLIMDEYESILPQALAKTNRNGSVTNPILHWLLTTSRILIAADAELSSVGVWVLENCRPSAFTIYHRNTYPTWEGTNVLLVGNNARLASVMCTKFTNEDPEVRRRIYASFYSVDDMLTISEHLDNHPLVSNGTLRKQVYDAKNTPSSIKEEHFADINRSWTAFDLVMASPMIESGLSFTAPHFHWLFAFFEGAVGVLKYEKLIQMIGRIRNITENNILMALDVHLLSQSIQAPPVTHLAVEQDILSRRCLQSRSDYDNIDSLYFIAIHKETKKRQSEQHGTSSLIIRLLQMGCSVALAVWKPPSFIDDFKQLLAELRRNRTVEEIQAIIQSPDISDIKVEELGWDLRFGNGISKVESQSLHKYYMRRFYGCLANSTHITVEWWNTYSPSPVKKAYATLCHLYHYRHLSFDEYLALLNDHERFLKAMNEKRLLGAEVLSYYRHKELEFTGRVLRLLKFDVMKWLQDPSQPLPQYDHNTFVTLSHQLHAMVIAYNKSNPNPLFFGSILPDAGSNTSLGLKGLLHPVGKNPSVIIWNLILLPTLGMVVSTSRKAGSPASISLKRPFLFSDPPHTPSGDPIPPIIRPKPLTMNSHPCIIESMEMAQM